MFTSLFPRSGIVPPAAWAGMIAFSGFASVASAGIVGQSVVDYLPGTGVSTSFQNSAAALGAPTTSDGGSDISPFTPPFSNSNIVIVGPTGEITLQFSAPLTPDTGEDIGVFTNTGLPAKNNAGTITAGTGTLGQADNAVVSVSDDGTNWITLNAGNPLNLTMPSNAYADAVVSGTGSVNISGGTVPADPYQPFTGTLSEFAGLTYPQMQTLLAGSFGGAWVDASSADLDQINFVRFDVPAGDRLVLDAVTGEGEASAVPEPATAAVVLGGALLLLGRRRR